MVSPIGLGKTCISAIVNMSKDSLLITIVSSSKCFGKLATLRWPILKPFSFGYE